MNKTILTIATVILLVATSCKKENLDSCTLSVTEVTEHRIAGQCIYTPNDSENGYKVFLTYTDQLTDKMRNQMLELYREEGAISGNCSFSIDSLASGETYYIMAVTFCEKSGETSIGSVKSLKQATLVSNDNRVEVVDASSAGATFNVQVAENNYNVSSFKMTVPGVMNNGYSAKVNFAVLSDDSQETIGNNCYNDGKLVCPVSFVGWPDIHVETSVFYGMDQDGRKYKATITVTKWHIDTFPGQDYEYHIY